MPSVLNCPHCSVALARPSSLDAGAEVRCPACVAIFRAPPDLPEVLPVLELVDFEPSRRSDPVRSARPARSLRRQPPPRKKRSSTRGLIVLGVLALLLLGVVGATVFFFARVLPEMARGPELPEERLAVVRRGTVLVKTQSDAEATSGSGFLFETVGDSGFILTNDHVLDTKQWPPLISVVFDSGTPTERTLPAELVFADSDEDLAVLRVRHGALPAPLRLPYGRPRLNVRQRVWALGFPADEVITRPPHPVVSVSPGWVSDLPRGADELHITNVIRPGNSGGPLVNSDGEVVGVVSAMFDGTDINMAIPRDRVERVLPGQVLAPTVQLTQQPGGAIRVQAQALRFDPRDRVSEAQLLARPRRQLPFLPEQHDDGTWEPLQPETSLWGMRLNPNEVSGEATLPAQGRQPGEWVFQVRYISGGKVRYSPPTVHPGPNVPLFPGLLPPRPRPPRIP